MSLDITVKINTVEKKLNELSSDWINQEIIRYKKLNQPVCIRITIKGNGLDMLLQTASCAKSGSGGRRANDEELRIFAIWKKLGLDIEEYPMGKIIAFLKQIT